MKHLKTFEVFESAETAGLTPKQREFLNVGIDTNGTWNYNPATGLVDVKGTFSAVYTGGGHQNDLMGIRFGTVTGYFRCSEIDLETLDGCPRYVGKEFNCRGNLLKTLEGGPEEVGDNFDCVGNKLTSLVGAPRKVGGAFICTDNPLTSLAGAPEEIGWEFHCRTQTGEVLTFHKGQWNLDGWLKKLKEVTQSKQELILTLLSPEFLNREIEKDPARMIMKLKPFLNDELFKEIQPKLIWPKDLQDDVDLAGDLDNIGF